MLKPVKVPTGELQHDPYASVICYPRSNPGQIQMRLEELATLGVDAVEFSGTSSAFALPVLGKGYVGIVAVAYRAGVRLALKMQRVDSERESLMREAELLRMANSVDVGPRFVGGTQHFLLMQLIGGGSFEGWLKTHIDATAVRRVVLEVLEQCWRLDTICLDHGELSKAPKHLLMDIADKPFIVDFETASTTRNASNVTSVCQYLFQGNSEACKALAQVLGPRQRIELVEALRRYRRNRDRESFEELLKLCLQS
ncbi:MAG: serine/threonine protein kinase [Candidatus Bathyarchaeota archaeon]|nr:serine/threonine protein kinase [Candidatus Bathyarchaeota archaeon]